MPAQQMRDSWQRRIDRASELATHDETARPLLDAYLRLLTVQRDCDTALGARLDRLTGSLERDLDEVRACVPRLRDAVLAVGPPGLVEQTRQLLDGGQPRFDSMLLETWRAPSGVHFFMKLLLQPYANCLAIHGIHPIDRDPPRRYTSCPFCGGAPQVSVLHQAWDGDAGGRDLVCAMCFTTWPFRRLFCAECGEDEERQLGYFQSPSYDHVRIDACETCKHYLKSVDLTRLGLAVPIVDEVAAAGLDLWAREHYQKIELNLVGL
jgi:FdhE protein